MPVEIRQLVVKSNVVQRAPEKEQAQPQKQNLEALRQSLLAECREMIADTLRQTRER